MNSLRTPDSPGFPGRLADNASLADRAAVALRDRIVSLRLPPGSRIQEEEVMEEIGSSRTPVREALLRLAQEGLVVVVPRRGTFVTDVNVGDVGVVYELRKELEGVAAGWAAKRRTDTDLPRLDKLIAEIETLPNPPPADLDIRSQLVIDEEAHGLMYQLSANSLLHEAASSHYLLSARMWFLASGRVSSPEFNFNSVLALLTAVRDQEAEAATFYARKHIQEAEVALRAAL